MGLWEVRAKQIAVLRSKSAKTESQSHHDAGLTIIFARCSLDHHASLRPGRSAELVYETLDALITGGETLAIHQILPDRHRVAPTRQPQLDRFAVRLAGAGSRTAAWR